MMAGCLQAARMNDISKSSGEQCVVLERSVFWCEHAGKLAMVAEHFW